MEKLVTLEQACRALGVAPKTVYNDPRWRQRLALRKVGWRWRASQAAVEAVAAGASVPEAVHE
jgi:hypothetical protein